MLVCDVVYMLRFLRFLARAGEACATVSNGWWTGGSAMSESQIYPKSFGLAVHCCKFQVLFFCFLSSRRTIPYSFMSHFLRNLGIASGCKSPYSHS